jgi:hypothetical protein
MKQTIFDIAENTLKIESTIAALEAGEMTDEQATEILYQALIHTEGDLKKKVEGYAIRIRQFESNAKARKEAAKALSESAQIQDNHASRLKATLKYALETLGQAKVETELFTVAIQKNGGVQPLKLAESATAETVPAEFTKSVTTVSIDNELVRKALEEGQELEFAQLGERGTSLRIK